MLRLMTAWWGLIVSTYRHFFHDKQNAKQRVQILIVLHCSTNLRRYTTSVLFPKTSILYLNFCGYYTWIVCMRFSQVFRLPCMSCLLFQSPFLQVSGVFKIKANQNYLAIKHERGQTEQLSFTVHLKMQLQVNETIPVSLQNLQQWKLVRVSF